MLECPGVRLWIKGQPFAGIRLAKCCVFSHRNTVLVVYDDELS
jgi:hypothetical protein